MYQIGMKHGWDTNFNCKIKFLFKSNFCY